MAEEAQDKPAGDQQQQARVQVDDKHALTSYANFCRVTGTPNGCEFRPKSMINSSGVPVTRQKLAYEVRACLSSTWTRACCCWSPAGLS